MSFDYLNEAFKKLSLLNEETFDTSLNGLNQLSDFMDKDASDDVVKVIDTDAEFEDEVQDSYIGKVITNCNVCHSHIFENKDEIVIDEDGLANADKPCPYCGEQAGFTIVGEITPYVKENSSKEGDPDSTNVTVDGNPVNESVTAGALLGTAALAAAGGVAGGIANAASSHVTKRTLDKAAKHVDAKKSEEEKNEAVASAEKTGQMAGAYAGAGLGASIGSTAGGAIGTAVGGPVGGVVGGLGGAVVGGAAGGAGGAVFGKHVVGKAISADEKEKNRNDKKTQEGLIGDTIRGAAKGFLGEEDQDEGLILDTARGAVKGALGISEEQDTDEGLIGDTIRGAAKGFLGEEEQYEGLILDTVRGGVKGALGISEEQDTDEGLILDTARGAVKGALGIGESTDEGLIGDTIRGAAKGFLGEEDTDEGLILDTVRGGIKGALGIGESTAVLDRPREKDLTKIQGTIADVLINHSAEIDACGANEAAVKDCITRILSSDEVKTPEAAQEAIRIINKCKGPKLWSTIGTYMSGLKVASSAKYARRRLDASLEEDVNNVNVETDDSIVNIHSEDGGKVTVSTEPKVPEVTGDEAISPLSDETRAEIESANGLTDDTTIEEPVEGETAPEEEVPAEGEEEMDIDEVDETALDELGESYLKEVYENVDSFKTSNVSSTDTHLVVEGVIKFKSGATKKTGFIFEAHSVTPDGKVRFTGKNEHFSRGAKSFILTGKIENKKLISESFTYNYRAKTADGKSSRIYGTVSKK